MQDRKRKVILEVLNNMKNVDFINKGETVYTKNNKSKNTHTTERQLKKVYSRKTNM